MLTTIAYSEIEVKYNGSKDDVKAGYNVWVELTNPTPVELSSIQQSFLLDKMALEEYSNKSKRPQIRVLENQKFALVLDMKFKDAKTLVTEGVYLFVGSNWLVTIHSEKVDLQSRTLALFEQKNKTVIASSIDALFYNLLAILIDSYEQLLTAIELSVTDFEQRTLYKPSRRMLEYLDSLSRQVIILRRHFWHTRDIINFLTHTEEDKEDVKYLKIIYDDINQLIDLVESYRDTINSTRELYIANVSLQMSDTMKTLTIFSAILLPLTFISSIYGMNGLDLQNMFSISTGFATVLAVMAAITIGLFIFFKKKQWILTGSDPLFSSADTGSSYGSRNKSTPSSTASSADRRESFERENDSKKRRHEDNVNANFMNPSDEVVKDSGNKIQRSKK
ncbi:MAG: magnesium transporter CorA family protein [Nitrososphaeraceae archaeon]